MLNRRWTPNRRHASTNVIRSTNRSKSPIYRQKTTLMNRPKRDNVDKKKKMKTPLYNIQAHTLHKSIRLPEYAKR